jgi:hypothetical protein
MTRERTSKFSDLHGNLLSNSLANPSAKIADGQNSGHGIPAFLVTNNG